MKASAVKVNGLIRDVYKDPITDKGKISKKGILALTYRCGIGCGWSTVRRENLRGEKNYLEVVYRNGQLLRSQSLKEIRGRSNDLNIAKHEKAA